MRYKVNIGYRRNRYFDSLDAACAFAQSVLDRTGVFVSIVACRRKVQS